jgi:hypothetical protein
MQGGWPAPDQGQRLCLAATHRTRTAIQQARGHIQPVEQGGHAAHQVRAIRQMAQIVA